jgi:hypothetical protein
MANRRDAPHWAIRPETALLRCDDVPILSQDDDAWQSQAPVS